MAKKRAPLGVTELQGRTYRFTLAGQPPTTFGQSQNRHHLARGLCCKIGMFEQLAIVGHQVIDLRALARGEHLVVLVIAMER